MIVIIVILILLLAPLNALMDWSSEGKFKSAYWNKDQGWRRKYKSHNVMLPGFPVQNTFVPYKNKWYHFGITPKFEEKFPYSTTILVFLTDGWHLTQFLFHSTWQLAIAIPLNVLYSYPWYFTILWWVFIKMMFSGTFELIYRIKK
tara:strand:+ start:78 stop:515 length:438 start_codon:yes stop_codon:yes gene_type:complete